MVTASETMASWLEDAKKNAGRMTILGVIAVIAGFLALAISLAGNVLSLTVRKRINKLIPVLVVIVGVLFILRGLSLGIPYLSPPKQKIEQKFEKSLQSETAELHEEPKGDCCKIE